VRVAKNNFPLKVCRFNYHNGVNFRGYKVSWIYIFSLGNAGRDADVRTILMVGFSASLDYDVG